MKLYQMILRKLGWWKEPPPEVQESKVYNPVSEKADRPCRVGSSITIDTLDYRKLNFVVKEIRESEVSTGGAFKFTDYVLLAQTDKNLWVRLRLVPEQDGLSRLSHKSFVLALYDELAYDEGLHNTVKDESNTGKFVVDDASANLHEEYFRVKGVRNSYLASVTSMKDENGDGRVDASEVKHEQVEFWDYFRSTTDEGVEVEQALFVEMNKQSGWFQLWRGTEVNPEAISVF